MSENGWTKGPYAYGLRGPECKITAIAHCGDYVIGPMSDYPGGNYRDTELGEQEDDARLIAAAPSLAEALHEMTEFYWGVDDDKNGDGIDPPPDCIVRARAALALARGER